MSRLITKLIAVLGFLLTTGSLNTAAAHESRPFLIEVTQINPAIWRVNWKIPPSLPTLNFPQISLPDTCLLADEESGSLQPETYEGARLIQCEIALEGGQITFRYPMFNPSVSTMIRWKDLKGNASMHILSPQETIWTIPAANTPGSVAKNYTIIGIEHIWKGWDHLLFLVCLLWIAGSFKRVLITITGFTIAHSFTLALSALEIFRIPVPPVEAAIALSIVFLAREILIGRRNSLTWNHPIAVSTTFGLLHGLGFAAVLGEIGLPQNQLVTGLLFFNVGVEIGQLIFVLAVAMAYLLLHSLMGQIRLNGASGKDKTAHLRLPAAYTVGLISSFWLIERVYGFY